mgnify:CR=1 FL=1|jgi:hypothetical protein
MSNPWGPVAFQVSGDFGAPMSSRLVRVWGRTPPALRLRRSHCPIIIIWDYGCINMPNLMKTTIEISDARLNAPKERATAQGTHGRTESRRELAA